MLNFICQVSSHQLGYRIKVGLQKGGIAFGFDAAVEDAIISKVPTLQQRRQHSKIMLYCRIRHQLANIPTATYIRPSTRNTQHYILPYARTLVFQTSFFPSAIKIWNNLQPVITNWPTIPQLRKALQSKPTSGRRGATRSAEAAWTPQAY